MKLGLLTDTHGEVALTQRAVAVFAEHGVECVIHCGDIGARGVVCALAPLACHFVFGNCDTAREMLAEAIADNESHILHGDFGELELAGRSFFFLHGHQWERLDRESASGRWDVVCYGHTHQASLTQCGTTLVINAGALHRVATPSVAILETETLAVLPVAITR